MKYVRILRSGLGAAGILLWVMGSEAIALDMPDQPLPNQQRAPCRRLGQVEISGGCWGFKSELPCEGKTYEWKGACYWPILARTLPPITERPQ